MAKPKKKRTKRYQGEDARTHVQNSPVVHRYEAVERNRLSQWWYERKRTLKPMLWLGLGVIGVVWLIIELIRLIF